MTRASQLVRVIFSILVLLLELFELIFPLFQINVGEDFETNFLVWDQTEGVVFWKITNFTYTYTVYESYNMIYMIYMYNINA